MSRPTIEIEGVTRTFGGLAAVRDLDFAVRGAACVGLLGPNGAGKTTTLKILTDLIFPTRGECFLNGHSVRRDRQRALNGVGVLIETPEIYPSLTGVQALRYVCEIRRIPRSEQRKVISEVLEEVGMSAWGSRKIGTLSKGMRQRINLATALVASPEIVILDEPSSGLDPRGIVDFREIVLRLRQEGRLVLLSSHILPEVEAICDQVALIDHGKLILHTALSDVHQSSERRGAWFAALFDRPVDDPLVSGAIRDLPFVDRWERRAANEIRFHVTETLSTEHLLLEALVASRTGLRRLQPLRSDLEELYISLVAEGESNGT